jgi:predicted dehydrogenase
VSRVRLAVVGVGHLGRIHARLAAKLPDVELVAVVDSRPEARLAAAAETGARAVAEYRDLIGEVDGAVVATPTRTHHSVASELMRGGIHLLVEKPMTASRAEADELVQLARRRHLVLQAGHVERFNPALVSVQHRLSEPKYIEARRQSGYTFRSTDIGVVFDLMVHDIDVTLSLVKSPIAHVEALGVSVMGDHEDMVNARLRFSNGAVANLTASRTSYVPLRTMHVFTPTCFASMDFTTRRSTLVEPRADLLWRKLSAAALADDERERLKGRLFEEVLIKSEAPSAETNALEQELLDFAAAIRSGRAPRVTGADGRDAVAAAEMILECVRDHLWDGRESGRQGPLAMPIRPFPPSVANEGWAIDETVILPRKAG